MYALLLRSRMLPDQQIKIINSHSTKINLPKLKSIIACNKWTQIANPFWLLSSFSSHLQSKIQCICEMMDHILLWFWIKMPWMTAYTLSAANFYASTVIDRCKINHARWYTNSMLSLAHIFIISFFVWNQPYIPLTSTYF